MSRFKLLTIKQGVLIACTASLLPLSVSTVSAQDDKKEMIEEVIVTGSRIKRDSFSSSSPISVFNAEDISKAGVTGIDEFLKDVPAFTGYQMGTSTNNGSAEGQKKIDMRGLGFNRTLVVVNGRRTIGDVNGDGAVDLNTIPGMMVKRVEVLKDGASTIYGSDALAGVVNIILNDDFEGFRFDNEYGAGMEDSQAKNRAFGFMGGIASEHGNVVMSLSYSLQEEMVQAERPSATNAIYPIYNFTTNQFVPTASGSSNSRRMRSINNFHDYPNPLDPNRVSVSGSWIFDPVTNRARTTNPNIPGDFYNYAPVNALIQPNERWQFGSVGKVKINDSAEGYFEGLFTKRTSQQRLAPDASFRSTTVETSNWGAKLNDFVPRTNPYNPFGVNGWGPDGLQNTTDDLNPNGLRNLDLSINRRFVESGARLFRQAASTYRMVIGARGELAGSMDWDLSYTFAETEMIDDTKNYGRFDRWAIAVDPVACAADSACPGVLNPFGNYGSITPAQMAFLSTGSLKDQFFGKLGMFAANLSGDAFSMPGGSLGWSVGFEHRQEDGFYSPDEFKAEGLTTGGSSDAQSGGFAVNEFFGEVLLPVMDNLDIDLSVRNSDYNTSAGKSTTYKLGIDYTVTEDLRTRLNYSTGFRAPNISEINQRDSTDFPVVDSLCEFGDIRLAAGAITQTAWNNCQTLNIVTATIPHTLTQTGTEIGAAWQSGYTTSAPTKPLTPEESTSVNFGIVFTPSFFDGFQFSIDVWDIEIENAIGSTDINDLMIACMNSVGFAAPACNAFDGGRPYDRVNNFIYPVDVTNAFGNLGTIATNGKDVEAKYVADLDTSFITGFNVGLSLTRQDSYKRTFPLAGTRELAGSANGFEVFPKTRLNFGAGVKGSSWTFDWEMRKIGKTTDALRPAAVSDDITAEAMTYHDLIGSYKFDSFSIVMGINNATDEDAPRFHSAFNANTEPGMYDVIGRRLFTSLSVKF